MKRYLSIFIIAVISVYFLLAGIFGSTGYFYNKSVNQQIKQRQERSQKLEDDIKNLEEKKQILSSEEGLRDSAMGLGYYVEGDTVYLFNEPSIQGEVVNNNDIIVVKNSYKPLSVFAIILISIGASSIVTFLIWFLSQDRNSDEKSLEVIDDSTDSDLYIKA